MADDYYTCPGDVFEDERLDGADLRVITGHVLVVNLADDWGLFDGNARTLARKIGSTSDEVAALFNDLASRKLVRFYEVEGRGGTTRRVGVVIDFHTYRGHPHRIAYESKRGASEFPFEDGSRAAPRRQRGSDVEVTRKQRGSDVEVTRKQRGSDVEVTRKQRGSDVASRARDQHSTAQHSTDPSPEGEGGSVLGRGTVQNAVRKPASPLSGGQATHRMRHPTKAKAANRRRRDEPDELPPPLPPRPPKPPPLKPGTPEYDLAVREDDWEALGWEPA